MADIAFTDEQPTYVAKIEILAVDSAPFFDIQPDYVAKVSLLAIDSAPFFDLQPAYNAKLTLLAIDSAPFLNVQPTCTNANAFVLFGMGFRGAVAVSVQVFTPAGTNVPNSLFTYTF